jgi:cytoskeleton protein RodZ
MFEIGSTLRQARERRRLSFDQVEAETKIRTRYLRALEEEQFDILPGPTYVKGFLRTYAEYLNLDGQLFVDEFNSRYFDPFIDPEHGILRRSSLPQTTRHGHRSESRSVAITLAALSIVGLLVFMGLRLPDDGKQPGVPSSQTMTTPINGNLLLTATSALQRSNAGTTTAATRARPVTIKLSAEGGPTYVVVSRGSRESEVRPSRIFVGTLEAGAAPRVFTSLVGFTLRFGKPEAARLVVGRTAVAVDTTKASIDISPQGAVG